MNIWDVSTVRDFVEYDHAIHSIYIGMSIGHMFGLLTHYIDVRKIHLLPTCQMTTPRVSFLPQKMLSNCVDAWLSSPLASEELDSLLFSAHRGELEFTLIYLKANMYEQCDSRM